MRYSNKKIPTHPRTEIEDAGTSNNAEKPKRTDEYSRGIQGKRSHDRTAHNRSKVTNDEDYI